MTATGLRSLVLALASVASSGAMAQTQWRFSAQLMNEVDRPAYVKVQERAAAILADKQADVGQAATDEIVAQIRAVVAKIPVIDGPQPSPNSICVDLIGKWHFEFSTKYFTDNDRRYQPPRSIFQNNLSVGCMLAAQARIEQNRPETARLVVKWIAARLDGNGVLQPSNGPGGLAKTPETVCQHYEVRKAWFPALGLHFHQASDHKGIAQACEVELKPVYASLEAKRQEAARLAAEQKAAADRKIAMERAEAAKKEAEQAAVALEQTRKAEEQARVAAAQKAAELAKFEPQVLAKVVSSLKSAPKMYGVLQPACTSAVSSSGAPSSLQPTLYEGCVKANGAVAYQNEVYRRVDEAANRVIEMNPKPEAVVAGNLFQPPDLGLANTSAGKLANERFAAAIEPLVKKIAESVYSELETEFEGKALLTEKAQLMLKKFCERNWSTDPAMNARITQKCDQLTKESSRLQCRNAVNAVEKIGIEYSNVILVESDGKMRPINFGLLACSAGRDGFAVALNSSWGLFSNSYSITISNAVGVRNEVIIKIEKATKNGKPYWHATELLKERPPIDDIYMVLSCFQNTYEDAGFEVLVKGGISMAASQFGIDAESFGLGLFDSMIEQAKCGTYKNTWKANIRMLTDTENVVDLVHGLFSNIRDLGK
ncbi:hypothetical protein [Bosea sp. RAC05]|uniref:hypothetical protein n=1 Tax=Bosea sp. RAC05 TaxID=1842539 RepID=UPI00085733A4|nr:hypothetical protein [Bosea sp. RAC05]AOG03021.1 hypothetical protein BSY19_4800 [Bosea sp. RAC05]